MKPSNAGSSWIRTPAGSQWRVNGAIPWKLAGVVLEISASSSRESASGALDRSEMVILFRRGVAVCS